MMLKRNREPQSGRSNDAFDKALDWEASRILDNEKSKRTAWMVAAGLGFLMVLSWIGMVLMLPLKETQPYVVRVDNATGAVDVVTVLQKKNATYDEVIDKYWAARYIEARETYDWQTLQNDYNTVNILSNKPTASVYNSQFGGENGKEKKIGNRQRVIAEVVSVVPNAKGESGDGTATVRFRTKTTGGDGTGTPIYQSWIATIGYHYVDPSAMKESYRLKNPLGFQVLTYRVDPENVGSGGVVPGPNAGVPGAAIPPPAAVVPAPVAVPTQPIPEQTP